MYTNVNFPAPLGAMALLGFAFVVGVVGLFLLYLLFTRKFARARLVMLAAIAIAVIYLSVVLIFSFRSTDYLLARGQEKHFCELDCHLAYSIAEVGQARTIGAAPQQAAAAGMFTLVTIKTRFDENTIGVNRGNGQLYPNPRAFLIVDEQGRSYAPSESAQQALQSSTANNVAITAPLRPGETYTTTIAFDLPLDVKRPTLLLNDSSWVTHFIIGHENSPLHKKTRFQL